MYVQFECYCKSRRALTPMLPVANLANRKLGKTLKMTETLAHGYSSEST